MKKNTPLQRTSLPKTYLMDLETRVFEALELQPERQKSRSLFQLTPKWAIAASFLIFVGSYFFFNATQNAIEYQDLETAQIADYLTNDYEASLFLDNQLGTLEDPFNLINSNTELDIEDVRTYLTNDISSFWINKIEENEE